MAKTKRLQVGRGPRSRTLEKQLGALALITAAAGAFGFAGCDGADDEAGCVSDEMFFAEQVWAPILSQKCIPCHNPQGVANNSKMVLKGSSEAGFLDANMAILREVASFEKNGEDGAESILLLKPTKTIDHGGGLQVTRESAEFEVLAELVERFKEPSACETDIASFYAGVQLATPVETLRKAALAVAGRLPTQAEHDEVAAGADPALRAVLDRMMTEETFFVRLREIYNDLFLTDRYLNGNAVDLLDGESGYYDREWYRNISAAEATQFGATADGERSAEQYLEAGTNRAVAREPLELIVHVARENRPFTEILTADYMMVNPLSARAFMVPDVTFENPADRTVFKEARTAIPHAGVLTSPMFLNRFPTTETNRNRHRARMVYQFFLGTDILKTAEQPIDPTKITDFNPTRENPTCTVCHANIDPIAGAFHNFDERARYDAEDQWYTDMRPPGFGSEAIPYEEFATSLPWLARRLAADKRFPLSVVNAIYTGYTGQKPLLAPADSTAPSFKSEFKAYLAQYNTFNQIADEFVKSNYNVKAAVKAIILSPYYRAKNSLPLDLERAGQLEHVGAAQFLTPEGLNRKVRAILGRPWNWELGRRDLLLDDEQYMILYGGIDSDSVTTRVLEPNGIMANVADRMANEMACWTTAADFAKPAAERLLFPKTEMTFRPKDENGFPVEPAVAAIKENIQHLHSHILGEVLAIDDPEIQRTYDLFIKVYDEGVAGMAIAEGEEGHIPSYLPWACQSREDFYTGEEFGEEDERLIQEDDEYVIRSWMAVVTYLLSDYSFIHE